MRIDLSDLSEKRHRRIERLGDGYSVMRMPFFAELRWLIGGWFLDAMFALCRREMTLVAIVAFGKLIDELQPDPRFETLKRRRQ